MSENETNILRCPVFLKYSRSYPLMKHEIPHLPLNKIGLNIAHWGLNFLVIFDCSSRCLEIVKLRYKTSLEIINALKYISSRLLPAQSARSSELHSWPCTLAFWNIWIWCLDVEDEAGCDDSRISMLSNDCARPSMKFWTSGRLGESVEVHRWISHALWVSGFKRLNRMCTMIWSQ